MKRLNKLTSYMAAVAAAAMLFAGCSKDSDNGGDQPINPSPENPSKPEVSSKSPAYVVYEANPRFFGTENCLNALASNLQRIANMGCDIVWIMPVCEPSSEKSVGSPYSIKNYDAINPKYGTIADLQNLVKSAHNLGLKVLLDWVPNHTGWDNPWITEHPDWFMQKNGQIISPPGQNWNDVAQLDYSNPEVAVGMSEAIKYWITTADIDGFRFDYADSPNIPVSFWTDLAKDLKAMRSDILLLAESSNYSFYSYGYDMIYDWGSAPTLSTAFKSGKAAPIVQEGQNAWAEVPEGDSILRYVFNHDTMSENAIDTYYGALDALPAAYVLTGMLNGTPLIYSGMDAEGLKGTQSFFNYKTISFNEVLTPVYKAINDAYKATKDVRAGSLTDYSSGAISAFTWTNGSKNVLVVVNCSGSEQQYVTPMSLRYTKMTDLINGASSEIPVTINLGAYGYAIYMN
ncbi:MAG: hypothetical protein J1E16_07440 [Muribaculaceae bacterium]|nr:hypothetical protein [Muribaculaceae bacterium]